MRRRALERLLTEEGAVVKREGGEHTIWINPKNGKKSSVPRHAEIKKYTARAICKDLGIDPKKVTS